MEPLINYLRQFGPLSEQQIEFITQKPTQIELPKDAYFSQAGKQAQQVGFVLEGIIRDCFHTPEGEEITRYFIDENNFVVDVNSYTHCLPSTIYLQAITPCRLLVFGRQAMTDLSTTVIGWDEIVSKITAKALWQNIDRISPMLTVDATTRYHRFMTEFPNLANRIPLAYIASYLGITQSSLSRIRKQR